MARRYEEHRNWGKQSAGRGKRKGGNKGDLGKKKKVDMKEE